MLQLLRGPRGGRTRALAALLVVGMLAAAAPAVVDVAKWVVRGVSDAVVGYSSD